MKLKDFIKETLTQITAGITESQKELKETGVIIVPKFTKKRENSFFVSQSHDATQQVNEIKFKVGITIEDNKGEKGGIGVLTGFFTAGGQVSNDESTQSVSSIEFTIPVVFPAGNDPKKEKGFVA